jgi:hypothetical protein
MLTLYRRRPSAQTISGLPAHQVNWRAANDASLDDDDPLATARGIVTGVILGVAVWAILAGLAWWVVHLLATGA